MARVSKETATRHRSAIVRAASRLFRARGLDGVGVAEITRAAGLTHGGFYGHFASKEALAAEAVTAAFAEGRGWLASQGLERWIRSYLSRGHRDRAEEGCPLLVFPARIDDTAGAVEAALAGGAAALISEIEARLPEIAGEDAAERRRRAMRITVSAVGAQVVARALAAADRDLSDAILATARELAETLGGGSPAGTRTPAPAKG